MLAGRELCIYKINATYRTDDVVSFIANGVKWIHYNFNLWSVMYIISNAHRVIRRYNKFYYYRRCRCRCCCMFFVVAETLFSLVDLFIFLQVLQLLLVRVRHCFCCWCCCERAEQVICFHSPIVCYNTVSHKRKTQRAECGFILCVVLLLFGISLLLTSCVSNVRCYDLMIPCEKSVVTWTYNVLLAFW